MTRMAGGVLETNIGGTAKHELYCVYLYYFHARYHAAVFYHAPVRTLGRFAGGKLPFLFFVEQAARVQPAGNNGFGVSIGLGARADQHAIQFGQKDSAKGRKKGTAAKTASKKKLVVFFAVLFNFGLLLFFKYFNFFGETVNSIFGLFADGSLVPHLKLIMPLGISYYTLQSVSYVVDVVPRQDRTGPSFWQACAVRFLFSADRRGADRAYGQLARQLYEPHRLSTANLMQGMQMILWGLFKKDGGSRPGGILSMPCFMTVRRIRASRYARRAAVYHSNLCRFFWRDGYCARSGSIIWHPDGAELPPPVFLNLRAGILAPLAYHAWRMAA